MPGSFIDCPVTYYLYPKFSHFRDKENTFITIFGPHQDVYLTKFLENERVNILYKSLKAINTNYRQDDKIAGRTRNTVVVWEWYEDLPPTVPTLFY